MENLIKISPSVIESIVLITVDETENVYQPTKLFDKIKGKLVRIDQIKGTTVKVEQEGQNISVEVYVDVDYGIFIPDAVKKLQEEIKSSLEIMTNLNILRIDVVVQGLKMENKEV